VWFSFFFQEIWAITRKTGTWSFHTNSVFFPVQRDWDGESGLGGQNLKATAMRIPIPESTPKFFNQLPILDRKEMWGASWGLSNILVTWRLLVKSEECCCCTATNISAIAAAGLRGFSLRAGCNCNKVPRALLTSNGSWLINLSPCSIIDGSMVVHVPFLYVWKRPLKLTKLKCQ
jgi:hypothetical protein